MDLEFPFRLLLASQVTTGGRTPLISRRNHEVWVMEYVLSGSGHLLINGQNYEPEADSIYILSKGSNHTYYPDKDRPWEKKFIVVDGKFADLLFQLYHLETKYYLPGCQSMLHYFSELQNSGMGADANTYAAVIFHQLIAEYARHSQQKEQSQTDASTGLKQYLDRHIEGRFELKNYAASAGYSHAHLIRKFKAAYGQTPYDYLMNKKIETARNLLAYSNLSIKEIAYRLGFADPYHFSSYFKRRTGICPSRLKNGD